VEILKHPTIIRLGISTQVKKTGFPRTWAFDVHEVRVGRLYETLQLVLLQLGLGRGVEEIDGERLFDAM
jgi:hypothetical protein